MPRGFSVLNFELHCHNMLIYLSDIYSTIYLSLLTVSYIIIYRTCTLVECATYTLYIINTVSRLLKGKLPQFGAEYKDRGVPFKVSLVM